MRVGVIGTGFGKRVVAPVYDATEGCEVVDVVSARDDSAVAELVTRADVDLISVHSPPFLHAPHVRAALGAGKAIVCDKPFALTVEEAARLHADADDAGALAFCNFEFRYAPARAMLRDMVRDQSIGIVQHVQWTHLSSGSRVPLRPWGWLFDRALGGGWIGAWGSHAIDMLRYVFGSEITDVQALLRIDIAERTDTDGTPHLCTAEDGFSASLVLGNGVTVAIDSGFAAAATLAPRFTLFATEAVVDVFADERIVVRTADGETATIDIPAGDDDRHLAPMRRFAEVVRDAVASGEIPEDAPTFADGHACDEVLDRLRAEPYARANDA
jgi:predicted dehydrogenase